MAYEGSARSRRRWMDNIKIILNKYGRCVDWINLGHCRFSWPDFVTTVMIL
jgi:hypothetical protein